MPPTVGICPRCGTPVANPSAGSYQPGSDQYQGGPEHGGRDAPPWPMADNDRHGSAPDWPYGAEPQRSTDPQ
ncbi:MAG: hypothetical protein WCA46_01130, partial [Actinocatenispora sp.]